MANETPHPIRVLRETLGFGQRELAERAQLSRATLQRLEGGASHRGLTTRKLAAALGVPVWALTDVSAALEYLRTVEMARLQRYGPPPEPEFASVSAPTMPPAAVQAPPSQPNPPPSTPPATGPPEASTPTTVQGSPTQPREEPAAPEADQSELLASLPQNALEPSIQTAADQIKRWLASRPNVQHNPQGRPMVEIDAVVDLIHLWATQVTAANPDDYDEVVSKTRRAARLPDSAQGPHRV